MDPTPDQQLSDEEKLRRCPRCFGRDIRLSYQTGFIDAVAAALSFMPRRCRACGKRFYRHKRLMEGSTGAEPQNPGSS